MLEPVFTLPPNIAYTDAANAFTTGNQQVIISAAGMFGLRIKGAASQAGDLQQWQDSAGTPLASVNAAGKFVGDGSLLTNLPTPTLPANVALKDAANTFTTGTQTINTGAAATVGLVVKGAASQTGNLQQWQDSTGAVVASMSAAGLLAVGKSDGTATNANIKINNTSSERPVIAWNAEGSTQGLAFYNATTQVVSFWNNGLINATTYRCPGGDTFSDSGYVVGGTAHRFRLGSTAGLDTHRLDSFNQATQQTIHAMKSSTTNSRETWRADCTWVDSTDASRKARVIFSVSDIAAREVLRFEGSGTAAMIGFLGANATARPVVSGSRGGNAALASLLTALATLGLITDSTVA